MLPEGATGLLGAAEVFPNLGVAVLDAMPRAEDYLAVEPERVVHAIQDESEATWGLQATAVVASTYTGAGIKVAVLDTGMDPEHPDFEGRAITSRSFLSGRPSRTATGTGRTASAPRAVRRTSYPATGSPRKRRSSPEGFNNAGSGGDAQILGGIDWAVANGCAVVSMSLGAAVAAGTRYSTVFETAAQRAATAGTLIVAAAGNNGPSRPVNHPANCPSIMAVAAVDAGLDVADFSARGLDPDGGAIDFSGPGVDVYSSVPMPERYDA